VQALAGACIELGLQITLRLKAMNLREQSIRVCPTLEALVETTEIMCEDLGDQPLHPIKQQLGFCRHAAV